MIGLIWELMQQQRIGEAIETARHARGDAAQAATERIEASFLPYMERLETLTLITQAMWALLKERTGLTDEDLMKKVLELDREDGVEDGRAARKPIRCPKCDAMMSPRFGRCLFCGESWPEAGPFSRV